MTTFLEELKERMNDAQKRLQVAAHALQVAQSQHQAIAQEFGSLQFLMLAEQKKMQVAAPPQAATSGTPPVQVSVIQTANSERAEVVNKTDIVRQLLQEHPNGMTPNDLWKSVSGQIPYRPYLYSILKRLRDKGDIFSKRGKYYSKMIPKAEDSKEQHTVQ